jgi:murein DD-endopeptidase MepM/ murein hydrolase activator NlpD
MRSAVLALVLAAALVTLAGAGPVAASASTSALGRATQSDWVWPVDGERWVLRDFVAPPSAYGAGHRGVDLAARAEHATVRSPVGGVVHFAGVVVDRPLVTVRTGQLLVTLEPVDPTVAEGDVVAAGDSLGTLEAGHCARPCVHLGVRLAGEYVSPLLYLGGLQRAVLLPLSESRG